METPPDLPRTGSNLPKPLLPWRPWVRPVIDLVPAEILSEIFLLVMVPQGAWYQDYLMLVCRRWYDIILSIPGIPTKLKICRATKKEYVQAFINRRKSRLDVLVNLNDKRDGNEFDVDNFHACFMAAAQVASRWRHLVLISPPPHGEYQDIHITQPMKHLQRFKLASGFGNLVEPLMTAIGQTATPHLTDMELADPVAVLYLGQPSYSHIFNSLSTLNIKLPRRPMSTPVDILPHLHRLEIFSACHLCLPIYPPDASLPLTQTLQHLSLQSASIQWMGGRIFPDLENCHIIFPHHADTIQPLQPVHMPFCEFLNYDSNDLSPLRYFLLPEIQILNVRCGQWSVWRGNLQLIPLHSLVTTSSLNIAHMTLDIQCSEHLLVCVLRLVPALEALSLGLASPNALSKGFFQAFILREPVEDDMPRIVVPTQQAIHPLCPSLTLLSLSYRRWLRGPGNKALIPVFADIYKSYLRQVPYPGLHLYLDTLSSWKFGRQARVKTGGNVSILCAPTTIPMSAWLPLNGLVPLPLKEIDYLHFYDIPHNTAIDFHFIHDHIEMRLGNLDQPRPPTSLPCNLPLFHALRVLVVENANPTFLTGHTFHKLERCRIVGSSGMDHKACQGLFTEMPICTRMDICDPTLLATFKLPQIRELGLDFSGSECSTIWTKHISLNCNLSGLKLLHMRAPKAIGIDLVQVLQSVPLLETLIISSPANVVTFKALTQLHGEGPTLAIPCPMLQTLCIEDTDPPESLELSLVLEEIVTLRAQCGPPLKDFTFYIFGLEISKIELIGMNGTFTMKETFLMEDTEPFGLDICLCDPGIVA